MNLQHSLRPSSALVILLLVVLGPLLSACHDAPSSAKAGQPIALTDATLLTMTESDSCTTVRIADPWQPQRTLATYVLVPTAQPLPQVLPEGTLVRTPLRRIALSSAVHAALLTELGAAQQVAGLMDTAYVVSSTLRRPCQSGAWRSFGSSMQPSIESLRAAQVDAVWTSPFEHAGDGALPTLGVPLIACADYMEASPLARAEWMRFYGRLVGQGARADSLYARVRSRYEALRRQAQPLAPQGPTVLCDWLTGATWYVPGGASTMGRFIADAGGRYLWADRQEQGSLSLSFEAVWKRGREADIWLIKYGDSHELTYQRLAADNPLYPSFAPWKQRRIFACNSLRRPFYEEVPFHPERLLAELIELFHPSKPGAPPSAAAYYQPLR